MKNTCKSGKTNILFPGRWLYLEYAKILCICFYSVLQFCSLQTTSIVNYEDVDKLEGLMLKSLLLSLICFCNISPSMHLSYGDLNFWLLYLSELFCLLSQVLESIHRSLELLIAVTRSGCILLLKINKQESSLLVEKQKAALFWLICKWVNSISAQLGAKKISSNQWNRILSGKLGYERNSPHPPAHRLVRQ